MKVHLNFDRHNFIHWVINVLYHFIYSLLSAPLGVYIFLTGLLLVLNTLDNYFKPAWTDDLRQLAWYLPFFKTIIYYGFYLLGPWYSNAPEWWTMFAGIPFIFYGTALIFFPLARFVQCLINPSYNLRHCLICRQPISLTNPTAPRHK